MLSFALVALIGTWSCEAEDARVTSHLRDALAQLRSVTPPGLNEPQRVARQQLLLDLERYIETAEFPRSTGAAGPVFVDADGRHCAMGALLASNGGRAIVEHVRATRNLATVPELVDEPGLVDWLTEHGLVPEEAALVQPGYYACAAAIELCVSKSQPLKWFVRGDPPRPNDRVLDRAASSDGQCAGDQGYPRWREFPHRTLYAEPLGVAVEAGRYVEATWASCRDPLRIDPHVFELPTVADCMRQMISDDARAMLPVCAVVSSSSRLPERCAADGRFLSWLLPTAGVEAAVREELALHRIDPEDAGLSLAAAATVEAFAWAHSDDGGTVPEGDFATLLEWDGSNPDTCVFLPNGVVENRVTSTETAAGPVASRGCTSVGVAALLPLVLLVLRRRQRE